MGHFQVRRRPLSVVRDHHPLAGLRLNGELSRAR